MCTTRTSASARAVLCGAGCPGAASVLLHPICATYLVTPKSSHAFQEYSFLDSEAFEDTKPRKQTLSFRLGPPVPKSILRSKDSHALEGFPFALAPVPKSKPLSFLGFAPEMRTKRPPTDEPDNARATKTAKSE